MALPKKGTRQIVVGNATHRYQIRKNCSRSRMLTVEFPDGKVLQHVFEKETVTPKDVEAYINERGR